MEQARALTGPTITEMDYAALEKLKSKGNKLSRLALLS
jgi:hypothetical protein